MTDAKEKKLARDETEKKNFSHKDKKQRIDGCETNGMNQNEKTVNDRERLMTGALSSARYPPKFISESGKKRTEIGSEMTESSTEQNKKNKHSSHPILIDANLPSSVQSDPRGSNPNTRLTTKASNRGKGRNTESFDPSSTLVRPDLRVKVGSNSVPVYNQKLRHDDVLIVPELFGKEDDWELYYKLIEEMTELQKQEKDKRSENKNNIEKNSRNNKKLDWIPWHEGAHLIVKDPTSSPTFQKIIDKLCTYFSIRRQSIGTRFNWYRDSSDWKPFHHDSAAFNPQRAKNQNITVGVSFGATRELAFVRAYEKESIDDMQHEEFQSHHGNRKKVRIYFPQTNNGVFSFGRDANILWKHGVNALAPEDQDGKGRISIILWGLAENVLEESCSPPLLGSDGNGPHASKNRHMRRHDTRGRDINDTDRRRERGNRDRFHDRRNDLQHRGRETTYDRERRDYDNNDRKLRAGWDSYHHRDSRMQGRFGNRHDPHIRPRNNR